MNNIGILMLGVGDIRGGGGAERYFADLVAAFAAGEGRRYRVHLITDGQSLASLRSVGRELPAERVIMLNDVGPFNVILQSLALFRLIRSRHFHLVHIAMALPRYLPWLWVNRWLPRRFSVPVVVNINDDRVGNELYADGGGAVYLTLLERCIYRLYFSTTKPAGILSWYALCLATLARRFPNRRWCLAAARHFFVDNERFSPAAEKKKIGVFAGRLIAEKRPAVFVRALAAARELAPEEFSNWHFYLFGDGPERSSVSGEVAHLALNDSVTLGDRTEYEAILAVSSLYISTQILENFSSLAMLEAMAAGNAVVAQNVGQTREFVRDSSNGILVEGAGAEDFGRALVRYFSQEDRDGLGRESRRIAENEHCVANVMDDFEAYWDEVLDLARACGHRVDG